MKENALLPNGFADVLYPDAGRESHAMYALLGQCEAYGYAQVKAPLMEFDENYRFWSSERVSAQAFRVMDPASQASMALRSDITTQVMRIVSTRLQNEKRPLRVCYGGQVLRTTPKDAQHERQFGQVGLELIGDNGVDAALEVVSILIASLSSLGIEGLTLDITVPSILRGCNLDEDVLKAIEQKDEASLRGYDGEGAAIIQLLKVLEGTAEEFVAAVANAEIPAEIADTLRECAALVEALGVLAPDVSISVDLLDISGFDYYTGATFSLYSQKTSQRLAQGGCYRFADTNEPAVGGGIDIMFVTPLMTETNNRESVLVPVGTSVKQLTSLQGKYDIRFASAEAVNEEGAKQRGCAYLLVDGKAKAV